MDKNLKRASKFMSLLLRHKPETVGLLLDEEGWTSVADLIEKTSSSDTPLTADLIEQVVVTNDKQRFKFSEDRQYIRANQGHSLDVNLKLEPRDPPDTLFHGTAKRFLQSILGEGLLKRSRQHVHLSLNVETALNVGTRHGSPVILEVDTLRMKKDGYKFYLSDNGVWLTDRVPSEYLKQYVE